MTIRPGDEWGHPATAQPDLTVEGDDTALAAAVAARPGVRVALGAPSRSDFARAVGATAATGHHVELPCDALTVDVGGRRSTAVNMVVAGVPPDRQRWWSRSGRVVVRVDGRDVHDGGAVAVLVANGQFLRGLDVVPRGHPGDGRLEVQVYALARGERRGMRVRLGTGEHLPHPRITVAAGRRIEVRLAPPRPLEVDGLRAGRAAGLTVAVAPRAFTLVV